MFCYLYIFFSSLICSYSCETFENYKIEPVLPGLYNSDIGKAHVSFGHYEIFQYYNISDILNDDKNLNVLLNDIKNHTNDNLSKTLLLTENTITNILDHTELLKQLCFNSDENFERFKRGLLGQILTFFFGLNDEAYEALNELQAQNNDLLNYTKNSNQIFQEKLYNAQKIVQTKIKVISDELQNDFLLFKEDILENQILANVKHIEKKIINILRAVNGKGEWFHHFLFKNVEELLVKANKVLKNQVYLQQM